MPQYKHERQIPQTVKLKALFVKTFGRLIYASTEQWRCGSAWRLHLLPSNHQGAVVDVDPCVLFVRSHGVRAILSGNVGHRKGRFAGKCAFNISADHVRDLANGIKDVAFAERFRWCPKHCCSNQLRRFFRSFHNERGVCLSKDTDQCSHCVLTMCRRSFCRWGVR